MGDPMQTADDSEQAAIARREVIAVWAFAAFLLLGMIALAIDALWNYA